MPVDMRYVDAPNEQWVSALTGATYPIIPPPPPGPVFGPVVYSTADMAAWTTGSEFTALSNDSFCSLSRSITDHGTSVTGQTARSIIREDGRYALCQAVMWKVDANASRLAKVIAVADGLKDITSWTTSNQGQDNLEISWGLTNLLQALAIIGRSNYDNASFDDVLRNRFYAQQDWTTGANWFFTFADVRLAIASYLGDAALWADAKAYLSYRIKQNIYHWDYDNGFVEPVRISSAWPNIWPSTTSGSINDGYTLQHWNNQVASGSPYEAGVLYSFPDGTGAERRRDLGHESQGMESLSHALRTIIAVEGFGAIESHIWDRSVAFINYHASRCLAYLNTGTIPTPAGTQVTSGYPNGVGGEAFKYGWFGAKKALGTAASSDVDALLVHATILAGPPEGGNQVTAERVADA